jgi:hypothetical protein
LTRALGFHGMLDRLDAEEGRSAESGPQVTTPWFANRKRIVMGPGISRSGVMRRNPYGPGVFTPGEPVESGCTKATGLPTIVY